VWRTRFGEISTAWAAHMDSTNGSSWRVWVNVSVPPASDGTEIRVMLPQSTAPADVCAWECGLSSSLPSSSTMTSSYDKRWISFDAAGGHMELKAITPSVAKLPSTSILTENCMPIWRAGKPVGSVAGVKSVGFLRDSPGRAMFPALSLAVSNGDFAVFATQSC
jgi:hypothetical protein